MSGDLWQKDSSKTKPEGLQGGSGSCCDIWLGDSGTDKKVEGRTEDAQINWTKVVEGGAARQEENRMTTEDVHKLIGTPLQWYFWMLSWYLLQAAGNVGRPRETDPEKEWQKKLFDECEDEFCETFGVYDGKA